MKQPIGTFVKQNKKTVMVFSGVLIALLIFAFNLGNISSECVKHIYRESVIEKTEFAEKVELKDMVLTENNAVLSKSVDSWIYIPYSEETFGKIFCIDLMVESATNTGEKFEIYFVDSYAMTYAVMEPGIVHIDMPENDFYDYAIRLDLSSRMNETIEIHSITLNDTDYITGLLCKKLWQAFLWILAVFAAYCSMGCAKMRRETDKTKTDVLNYVFCALLGLPFALMLSFQDGPMAGLLFVALLLSLLFYAVYNAQFDLYAGIIVYGLVHSYIECAVNGYTLRHYMCYELFDAVFVLNILLFATVLSAIQKLIGKNIGALFFYVLFAIYTSANLIKLHFQNALLSVADLSLIREIIGIAGQYIRPVYIITIIAAIALLGIIIRNNKDVLKQKLKPEFSLKGIPYVCIVILLLLAVSFNVFIPVGLNLSQEYYSGKDKLNTAGFGIYTYVEFVTGWKQNEPDGYGESVTALLDLYLEEHPIEKTVTSKEVTPNVILILAESLFEVETMPGIMFSKPLTDNLAPYKVTNLISPAYGGRTAATEFEALTGLSNAFLAGDTIAYTAYLNEPGKEIGSLAREFKKNQYTTYAIHANVADYYHRDMVYKNMGFDDFISIEDMALGKGDRLKDGYAKDDCFFESMLTVLENSEEPVFIFGASIEGHSPYYNKYDSIEITADSNQYDASLLNELSCYAQTVYNFNRHMGELLSYLEKGEEPTIVYIYGDHLPPLQVNEKAGYLSDVYLKYTTPLYAFSNYCDVLIEEDYLSMNQIAPEILRKAGITYHSYYDFIYAMRGEYPVIHKEFTGNQMMDETMRLYQNLQYDLLFGKQYVLKP